MREYNMAKYLKRDVVNGVAEQTGLSKRESGELLEVVIDVIKGLVKKDGDVLDIQQFIKIEKKMDKPRIYRNPRTHEAIHKDATLRTRAKAKF